MGWLSTCKKGGMITGSERDLVGGNEIVVSPLLFAGNSILSGADAILLYSLCRVFYFVLDRYLRKIGMVPVGEI